MSARNRSAPRKRPRQERAKATVETILEAAAHVLVTSGYEGTTTKAVADRTGRPVRLAPRRMRVGEPSGFVERLPDEDVVHFEQETSGLHQAHIVCHELAHLLCGHLPEAPQPGAETATVELSTIDPAVLRRIRDLLPWVLGFIALLTVMSAGLGWVLAAVTGIDLLTAILATSPGGMDGAMIAALDTGANVPLVLAVQISRLLLMVIAGPLVVKRLAGRGAGR